MEQNFSSTFMGRHTFYYRIAQLFIIISFKNPEKLRLLLEQILSSLNTRST